MTHSTDDKDIGSDPSGEAQITKVGLEEFLEDAFGLNIRSAKSIAALFRSPETYFKAAREANWANHAYTPSLRLWLGLTAIIVALQFIWANPDGSFMAYMQDSLARGLQEGVSRGGGDNDLSGYNFEASILKMFKFNTLIYPFIFIFAMSLLAWMFGTWAWGRKLPYVVRQRYIFAVLIPGSVIGVVTTILMTFASGTIYQSLTYLQALLMVVLYFVTALRGPYAHLQKGEAYRRSILLSLGILAMAFISQMIAIVISMTYVMVPDITAYIELQS